MRDYVEMRRKQDREEFLDSKIRAVKPIFKNFVDNNTNILRREVAKSKIKSIREKEQEEEEIQKTILEQAKGATQEDGVTPKYRCYDPEALAKTKPVKAVEVLIGGTASNMQMSKTAGPNGFRKPVGVHQLTLEDEQAKSSNHLLEKLRRNKAHLALQSQKQKMKSVSGLHADPSSAVIINDYFDGTHNKNNYTNYNKTPSNNLEIPATMLRNNQTFTSMKVAESPANQIDPKSIFKSNRLGASMSAARGTAARTAATSLKSTLKKGVHVASNSDLDDFAVEKSDSEEFNKSLMPPAG